MFAGDGANFFVKSYLVTLAVGNAPHQPHSFKFRWPWLHYSEESDTAYSCIIAYSEGNLQSVGGIGSTYISKGYNNWKVAAVKFSSHEVSVCHKNAALKTVTHPSTHKDIAR